MSKIVYVPQGRSARLVVENLFAIQALYTDGVTSCNILIAINNTQTKLVLIHIDARFDIEKIRQEIEWVGADRCSIFFREGSGDRVKDQIIALLPNIIIEEIMYQDTHQDGIGASFQDIDYQKGERRISPNIRILPTHSKPNELIHHPDEQAMVCVRKIEQLIGLNAIRLGQAPRQIKLCIFNGNTWTSLDKEELLIDNSHPETRAEVANFTKHDSFMEITEKLRTIAVNVNQVIEIIGTPGNLSMVIAPYMEAYLYDYRTDFLLKRNLNAVLDLSTEGLNRSEMAARTDLSDALTNKRSALLNNMLIFLSKYSSASSNNKVIDKCQIFMEHYNERTNYDDNGIDAIRQIDKRIRSATANAKNTTPNFLTNAGTNNIITSLNKITWAISTKKWSQNEGKPGSAALKTTVEDAEKIKQYLVDNGMEKEDVAIIGKNKVIISKINPSIIESINPMPKPSAANSQQEGNEFLKNRKSGSMA